MLPFNKAVENKLALIIIISCTCKLITVLILNTKQAAISTWKTKIFKSSYK